jgi:hypothetical protein
MTEHLRSFHSAIQHDPTASIHEKCVTWFLQIASDWHVSRAQQEIEWAESHLADRWGTISPPKDTPLLTLKGMEQMQAAEQNLAVEVPRNMLCVRVLLEIVVKILAHREIAPEDHFANGPILEMVRNALDALGWVKAETLTCGTDKDSDTD